MRLKLFVAFTCIAVLPQSAPLQAMLRDLQQLMQKVAEEHFGPFLRRLDAAFKRNEARRAGRAEAGQPVSQVAYRPAHGKWRWVDDICLLMEDPTTGEDLLSAELKMLAELIKEERDPMELWFTECGSRLMGLLKEGASKWSGVELKKSAQAAIDELSWRLARPSAGSRSVVEQNEQGDS